jgi:hypothetical protein
MLKLRDRVRQGRLLDKLVHKLPSELLERITSLEHNWPTLPVKRRKQRRPKFKPSSMTFERKSPNTASRKRTFSDAGTVLRQREP